MLFAPWRLVTAGSGPASVSPISSLCLQLPGSTCPWSIVEPIGLPQSSHFQSSPKSMQFLFCFIQLYFSNLWVSTAKLTFCANLSAPIRRATPLHIDLDSLPAMLNPELTSSSLMWQCLLLALELCCVDYRILSRSKHPKGTPRGSF